MNRTEILALWENYKDGGPDVIASFAKAIEVAAWEEFAALATKRASTERYKILVAMNNLLQSVGSPSGQDFVALSASPLGR